MDKLIGDLMSNTLRIPCPFMMSFVVHVPDQVSAAGEAKYKSARATQMADSQIGKFVPVWRSARRIGILSPARSRQVTPWSGVDFRWCCSHPMAAAARLSTS